MAEDDLENLVPGLVAGDERTFAALYDRLGPRMYRVARGHVGTTADAEDAVQEVFLSLVKSRAKLSEVVSLPAYVFAALRRAVLRRASRRGREVPLGDIEPGDLLSDPPRADEIAEDRVERALRALPELQREVVMLKIEGELTFTEIGLVLGVSPNTASSRYRYALEKMRKHLEVRPR